MDWIDKLIVVAVAVFVLGVFAMIGAAVLSSGRVDYCTVDTFTYANPLQGDAVAYRLIGHVPWRPNRDLAKNLKSLAEVKEQADLIGCEVK